jgi:hypothetical protein
MARKGANIDSDHMLVVIKVRAKICRASNTKPQQLRRFIVDRLKDRNVASRYYIESGISKLERGHRQGQDCRISVS